MLAYNANAEDVADILTLEALARGATDKLHGARHERRRSAGRQRCATRLAGARRLPLRRR